MSLNKRQELFCLEYTKDLNASQSALRAGYSKKTAPFIGAENLKKPKKEQRIAELMAGRMSKVNIDSNYVLNSFLIK